VDVVIKAQALTGGRGLGHFKNGFKGGVHVTTKYVGGRVGPFLPLTQRKTNEMMH